jgi:predicted CoA-substrate-specific enzyme activase
MSEYSSLNKQADWRKAETIVAGIDSGAVSSKMVILVDGQLYASSQVKTRMPQESAFRTLDAALGNSGLRLEDIHYLVATGRGRTQVPFARRTVTEVVCGAAGAVHIWGPSVRTVLDAGGQSCKVIHCNEKGKATSFLWNDKCAAGIGRSLETFADLAKKDVSEMGSMALHAHKFSKLGDFCAVYAQSEALDLLRGNTPFEEVVAGYHHAMARRISTLAARSGVKKDFVIIGGLSKNPAIVNWVESNLKVSRLAPKPEWDPAITVALGAALFAYSSYRSQ